MLLQGCGASTSGTDAATDRAAPDVADGFDAVAMDAPGPDVPADIAQDAAADAPALADAADAVTVDAVVTDVTDDRACVGVSLLTDPRNCGTCGHVCTAPGPGFVMTCEGGVCTARCPSGFENCDLRNENGCEANLASDVNNCGRCGHACTALRPCVAACAAGLCGLPDCPCGYGECDGNVTTRCETRLTDDPNNCGGCAHVCAAGEACIASEYVPASPADAGPADAPPTDVPTTD